MLTCIACSKPPFGGGGEPPLHEPPEDEDAVDGAATPSTRLAIKALTAQIKDMALKASGAYRHCKPCAGSSAGASRRHHPYHHRGGSGFGDSDAGSKRFHYAYRRAASSAASTPRFRGGGGALSSGDATPSMSARSDFPIGDEEEEDDEEMVSTGAGAGGKEENAKEWVAQVEPGVLITFVSLPEGGNDLKRIRFWVDGKHTVTLDMLPCTSTSHFPSLLCNLIAVTYSLNSKSLVILDFTDGYANNWNNMM
uniref:ATBRXL3/BRX-LIKE3 n=1 Tax=Oryza coarctata TaxID=77588 RepID=A0A8K1DH72_ORYCO|nr:ATBRXL3/BRX-LIKE3 [Oryza coarctata]